ncbi:hypothetical protein CJD36_002665 [Flavipsychrobacter stenotrophus]|uniref:Uncharacterized protein n=1 Tax=Flavipsychrobacter stenotrophus TaxID=2077091 RepID=A0A2S7T1I1_9BACT|nr:hypothetical protein [Flavipsychrobacter stenotrophus]PQJ12665.1 hypothetical protein CJD36_002665 [Flavipsychrobacter stenotrophus]
MKFLEKVFTIMALIGVLIKLAGLTGGLPLIALSLICLSIHYLLCGFFLFNDIRLRDCFKRSSYKEITALKIIGSLVSAVVLSVLIAGILYRLLYTDGNMMILIFTLALNVVFTLSLAFTVSIRHIAFYKNILIRSAILLIISACLTIAPSKYLDLQKKKIITEQVTCIDNSLKA